jgi:2-polyprenyl-6-hydroxyphenyl methylase/3-demethylubiquinone-9 3-methyltransferase
MDMRRRSARMFPRRSKDARFDSAKLYFYVERASVDARHPIADAGRSPGARSAPFTILQRNRRAALIPKNTICLWYDGNAEEAANFYAKTFPDSKVTAVHKAPGDFPGGKKDSVLTVEFTVLGTPCLGLNGGPMFKHSEAFSFQVATDDQAETDRYWKAIVGNGGQESACGWCKDKWGLSWQITPRALTDGMADPDPAVSKRVFDAMMTMGKIDIAAIEKARRG